MSRDQAREIEKKRWHERQQKQLFSILLSQVKPRLKRIEFEGEKAGEEPDRKEGERKRERERKKNTKEQTDREENKRKAAAEEKLFVRSFRFVALSGCFLRIAVLLP